MEQENLFFDGFGDSLRHLVRVLGGPKKVGATLRPGKSIDDAARWLSCALDDDRREALHLDDLVSLLRMGREAGCHAAMHELARMTGYGDPPPVEPGDQIADLQRQFIAAAKGLAGIEKRIEKLTGSELRSVV